jgi:hypothetical protein
LKMSFVTDCSYIDVLYLLVVKSLFNSDASYWGDLYAGHETRSLYEASTASHLFWFVLHSAVASSVFD